MNNLLTTYWIRFGEALNTHVGVTAYSYEDALRMLNKTLFKNKQMPPVKSYTENIKFSELDQNHVVPNMGPITERGVWFPNLFPL